MVHNFRAEIRARFDPATPISVDGDSSAATYTLCVMTITYFLILAVGINCLIINLFVVVVTESYEVGAASQRRGVSRQLSLTNIT